MAQPRREQERPPTWGEAAPAGLSSAVAAPPSGDAELVSHALWNAGARPSKDRCAGVKTIASDRFVQDITFLVKTIC